MTLANIFAFFNLDPAATNAAYLFRSKPNVLSVPDDNVHRPSQNEHA